MPKYSKKEKAKIQRQTESQDPKFKDNKASSRSSNERGREGHFQKTTVVTPNVVAANDEENNEDQGALVQDATETKYRRRKIGSNWDRFQEIGEERIVQRGEDFEHLLQSSGGLHSHFRFKEEKEWEEEDDEDLAFNSCHFLRIDCSALRVNLDAIPLHKRLGISEDIFTPKEIRLFQEVADKKRATLQKRSDIPSEGSAGLICESYHVAPSPIEGMTSPLGMVESVADSFVLESPTDPAVKSLPADLEDELDRLLSLSSNVDQSVKGTSTRDTIGHHSTSLEDLLDIDVNG